MSESERDEPRTCSPCSACCEPVCESLEAESWGFYSNRIDTFWPLLWGTSPYLSDDMYLGWRVFCVLFWTAIEIHGMVLNAPNYQYWNTKLTVWSMHVLSLWFLFGLVSCINARRELKGDSTWGHYKGLEPDRRGLPWYAGIAWFFQTASISATFVVTFGFWVIIIPGIPGGLNRVFPQAPAKALSILTHGVNMVFMILDLFLANTPIFVKHFWVPIVYTLGWMIFGYLYVLAGGTDKRGNNYIYGSLNWKKNPGKCMTLCAAILMLNLLAYVIFAFMNKEPRQLKVEKAMMRMPEDDSGKSVESRRSHHD